MDLTLLAAVASQGGTLPELVPTELLVGNLALQLAVAVALLAVAAFLLFLELIIVSGGILGVLSISCAALGCYLSYEVGPTAFGINILATPLVAIFTIRLGLKRMQQSSMIPKSSIDDNAGYAHVAEELGISVGSIGILSTNAMPTGRAKFTGGEIDISLQSGAGSKGQEVIVIEIDGPSIFVMLKA